MRRRPAPDPATWPGPARPGVTYFCFDADERVIYVGFTKNLDVRLAAHRTATPWWSEVAAVTHVEFPRWEDATLHEAECIRKLRPTYNIRGNPDYRFKARWVRHAEAAS